MPFWSDPSEFGFSSAWGFAVHECGHAWDFEDSFNPAYKMAENYTIPYPKKDYFARSEITKDRFHALIPNAAANDTYFDEDSETGHQGIKTGYDEWAQYNHSMAYTYTTYRFPETRYEYDIELALNFAWAGQRYLLWAKENKPETFNDMLADANLREATLALWAQTWLYYDAFINNTSWKPSAKHDKYLDAMRQPALKSVLNDVRKAHNCVGLSN